MRCLSPPIFAFLLALLSALGGCETPTPAVNNPTAPPGGGTSVADRRVTFADGNALDFKAFRHQAYYLATGQAVVLYIEPPVMVDDPDAVAQMKIEPGPGYGYPLVSVTADFDVEGRYGPYAYRLADHQPASDDGTAVVPLTAWHLSHLFPSDAGGNTVRVNGIFDADFSNGRSRMAEAMRTWQPIYDAAGHAIDAEFLIAQVTADPYPLLQRPPAEGDTFGEWEVAQTQLIFEDRRYRPYALVWSTTHETTGLEMVVIIEPQVLDPNNKSDRHELQLRIAFLGEPKPPHAVPTRLVFASTRHSWDFPAIPEQPNMFISRLPVNAINDLLCRNRVVPIIAEHEGGNAVYHLDTEHLGRALSELDDSFFDVEPTDLP